MLADLSRTLVGVDGIGGEPWRKRHCSLLRAWQIFFSCSSRFGADRLNGASCWIWPMKIVGERSGEHILAARARDRAMSLLRAGRIQDALEEFHKAKIEWWSGETVRGSLLAMILIARLYLELRLPQASKSYALAVAYIAASKTG